MVQRGVLEVDELNEWPDHPVLAESIGIGRLDLLLGVTALHDSHIVQEHEQIGRGENGLIKANTSEDLGIRSAGNADATLEEAEPLGGERTEDG